MHIVHHSTRYTGVKDAMDKSEGLKVLGFFFEVSPLVFLYQFLVNKAVSYFHIEFARISY